MWGRCNTDDSDCDEEDPPTEYIACLTCSGTWTEGTYQASKPYTSPNVRVFEDSRIFKS